MNDQQGDKTPRQTAHQRNQIQSLNSLLASGVDAWIDRDSGNVYVGTSKPTSNNTVGDDNDNSPQSALGEFRYKMMSDWNVPKLHRRVAERAATVASRHYGRPTTAIVFVELTDLDDCIQDFPYEISGFCYPGSGDSKAYILADGSVTPNIIENSVMHEVCHLATQASETEVKATTSKLVALYGLYDAHEGSQTDTRQTDYSASYFHPKKQTMQWANY